MPPEGGKSGDDAPYEARYEGHWSRLFCESCEAVFDVEGDVSNGEFVDCDACGVTLEVTGR